MNEDTFEAELHPWLDAPDETSVRPDEALTDLRIPYMDFGGQTQPAFRDDSAVIGAPFTSSAARRAARSQRRGLVIYTICAILCMLGLFMMFFVLGGRFIQHAAQAVLPPPPSRALVWGQTGNLPATPTPTPLPPPVPTTAPAPSPTPVVGIRPVHPILPPATPTPGNTATPSPTTTPVAASTGKRGVPSGGRLIIAPLTLHLACNTFHERPGSGPPPLSAVFTLYNPSATAIAWAIRSADAVSPYQGILAPDAAQTIIINDITGSSILWVQTAGQMQPITIAGC
jgi:hypothetical protein